MTVNDMDYPTYLKLKKEKDDIFKDKVKNSLLAFTLETKADYNIAHHHKLIARKLVQVAQGKIKRLMIFMPPRHGKSELVSVRFPAWVLGRNPNTQIIGTSYGAELASKMNRSIQGVIDMPEYESIFPETRLNNKNVVTIKQPLRNADVFEVVGYKGYYRSAGIGGAITGTGADILLIDDPIKNMKEADSLTYREGIWDWYTSTAYTRLERNGAIILVQTRWHEDDLAGRLLKKAKEDPDADQWDVLSLEAVREDMTNLVDEREFGQPLWPWKYDSKRLAAIKSSVGTRVWNALYQQRPTALEGGIIKRKDFKFYKELPAKFDRIIQSWDCTFGKSNNSDKVAGHVWGKIGAEFYLIDRVNDRMSYVETKQAIKTFSAKHPKALKKIIEKKANGAALIDDLAKEISGMVAYTPTESKDSRLNAVSPLFEAGNVYVPDPSIAPWVHDYINELTTFPNGIHDDDVDATSQALIELRSKTDWLKTLSKF